VELLCFVRKLSVSCSEEEDADLLE